MPQLSADSRITHLAVYRCEVEFNTPLRLSSGLQSKRTSLFLHWQIDACCYWTECSPLPGYSAETIEQCLQQLKALVIPLLPLRLPALIDQCPPLTPALDFAVCGVSSYLLKPVELADLRCCQLLTAGESVASVGDAECVKYKVGVLSLEQDLAVIKQLGCSETKPRRVRLDANQQWSYAHVSRLLDALDYSAIDWIEEPLAKHESYNLWATNLGDASKSLSFALDENLYQTKKNPLWLEGLKALILKPTLIGYRRTLALIDWGLQHHCQLVFSSSFETGVGMQCLYRLAGRWATEEYHGFDTLKYLLPAYRLADPKAFTCKIERVL